MNELRDGASFYKWSDEWTMLTEGKLRALGANDALLCLAGDTLVPTKEHGLVRIDHFGQAGSEAELTTVGRTGADKTKKWLYSGKGEVVEVKTHHGTTLKCTQSHRILVLKGNDLIWKEAKDLNLGDVLCFNKVKCLRESVLPLDLIAPIRKKYANSLNEDIIKPEAMTPDLAYLVGLLVSEGCVGKYRIRISNTNLDILHGAKEKFIKIFGSTISVKIRTCSSVGKPDKVDKNGTIWRTVKDSYELCIWSLTIASYFEQLGLCTAPGRQSRNKEVPWSILQADESCQRAYLAAYVDGDGSVGKNGKHVVFYSFSKSILSQTQSLLAAHGIDSRVRSVSLSMTRGNALALSEAIAEYSLSGKFNKFLETEPSEVTTKGNFPDREYGIKTDGIRKVLKDRFVRQVVNEGAVFLNDDGEEVLVQRFGRITIERWKHLVYRSFEAGEYDAFLSAFEKISISEYKKVLTLFSRKFKYTRVTAVERLEGKTHVYDIQMQTDPSFVANCLVVHNSGDATYSNQEAARSFFMDRANMLRQTLTQKVFMRKIFPLLAQVHGFTKRSQAELDHNIRVSNKTVSSKYMVTAQSQENYLIPTINWHKDLVSQIDDQKIERLKSLEELGFPITLKQYSAAANIDLDDLLQDTENDALIRKKIAEWKESAIPEDAEDLAKQDFVKSLRNLSESNLRQVVSSTDKLGPLRSYLFWNEKGNLGPLAAEELIPVIAHFDPGTNAVYATVADGALKKTLREMLGHPIKAELAHYLLHSTGFTPIRPVLSKDAIEVVSEQIKSCLDRHSLHGNVYQLSQIAQKELKALAEYSEQYISERIAKWNSSAPKIAKRDRIPNNSKQLFSGV
jgi:intein/homing endonuclease